MLETLKHWDRELFVWLNSLGIENLDSFWIFTTQIENWIPLFAFFIFLIFYFYKFPKGLIVLFFLLSAFLITLAVTDFTKVFVERLRPNNVKALSELIRVLQKPTNYSFFSGHASTSFAVTTFMALSIRRFTKWIYLIYLWPIIFVLSRIFVGVHYPSDIFVGALVGTGFAFIFHNICNRILEARFAENPSVKPPLK